MPVGCAWRVSCLMMDRGAIPLPGGDAARNGVVEDTVPGVDGLAAHVNCAAVRG